MVLTNPPGSITLKDMKEQRVMDETEIAWLAGLLEGEGSFLKPPPSDPGRPRISLEMTDQDVVERVAKMFEISYIHTKRYANVKHKDGFRFLLRGQRAVRLMEVLSPYMGTRRQAQINEVLNSYTEKPADIAKLTDEAVRDIRSKRVSMRKFAALYGVAKGTIQRVQQGNYYKQVV